MRKLLVVAVASGVLVGSAGGAFATYRYSTNVYATVGSHGSGGHAAIETDNPYGVCNSKGETWVTAGGAWELGAEQNLYRASDGAIILDGAMVYDGPTSGISVYHSYNGSGTYYYSLGKFAIYNGNGYNYYWTNRSPNGSC